MSRGEKRTGVRILLTPGTQIPDWIREHPNVSLGVAEIRGREIPTVDIVKGGASFIPGGGVGVEFSRRRVFRVAFDPNRVLEIQTLDGVLIKRSHHMCVDCGAITGERVTSRPSRKEAELTLAGDRFRCTQNPEHEWEGGNPWLGFSHF